VFLESGSGLKFLNKEIVIEVMDSNILYGVEFNKLKVKIKGNI
jgi:hypothetical protein